jgi:diguanylate cyclase (GGDEF)-like protein
MTEHPSEPQLLALARVAGALASAQELEPSLALVAETALAAVAGAASVSVNRAEHGGLRTLVRAGETPAGEPSAGDAAASLAVPIVVEGRTWGSLETLASPGAPPFGPEDLAFSAALAAHASAVIARDELIARLSALAYADALTGLPNRRALDECLEAAVARATEQDTALSLVFCDLDGLKEVNDIAGHASGDRALVAAAEALAGAVAAMPNGFLARLGGDEFCVLLEGTGADGARDLAVDASDRLSRTSDERMTFSCGVATLGTGVMRSADLLRAADAAQYAAKRLGRNRIFVAESGMSTILGAARDEDLEPAGRRRLRDTEWRAAALVRAVVEGFERQLPDADAARRLAALGLAAADAFDLAGWSISTARNGEVELQSAFEGGRRSHRVTGAPSLAFATGETYALADYPLTEAAMVRGGWFVVNVDDDTADPGEREVLAALGHRTVLAIAVRDGALGHLLELFTDERSGAVAEALPEIRLLALAAVVGTAGERQPASGSPLDSFGGS